MSRYVTEFIGTFIFVFSIGLVVTAGSPHAPLAIGSALMVMVYMGGHISGGHYNPAVTLAALMRGKMKSGDAVPYWIAQIAGGFVAAAVVAWITGDYFASAPGDDYSVLDALIVELIFTFALALVVLNVATARATRGNSFYGLAIGFTVTVGAFAGGHISGAALNPAVAIGPALVAAMGGGGGLGALWIYLVAPLAGGALAALVFYEQREKSEEE